MMVDEATEETATPHPPKIGAWARRRRGNRDVGYLQNLAIAADAAVETVTRTLPKISAW